MSDLATLLVRVRAATSALPPQELPEGPPEGRPGLSDAGTSERVAWLTERLIELRGEGDDADAVMRVDGEAEARDALREAISGIPRDQLLLQGDHYERRAYRVGVTPAVALIAETGSAIVDVPDLAAAWSSLAVDTHWVCACEEDLHADLVSYYATHAARLGNDLDRVQVQITGASRTADVEKVVVVPAHGPKQFRLLLSRQRVYWRSVLADLA